MEILEKQIDNAIIIALKEDKLKLSALRNIKTAIQVEKRSTKVLRELTDSEIIVIIRRLVKQTEDVAVTFSNNNRADLATIELNNAVVYKTFLPAEVDHTLVVSFVKRHIDGLLITGIVPTIGLIMGSINKEKSDFLKSVSNSDIAKEIKIQLSNG